MRKLILILVVCAASCSEKKVENPKLSSETIEVLIEGLDNNGKVFSSPTTQKTLK